MAAKKKLAKRPAKKVAAKTKYRCGACGKRGHNARTCGRYYL